MIQTPKLVLYSSQTGKLLIWVTEHSYPYPSFLGSCSTNHKASKCWNSFLVFSSHSVSMTETKTGRCNIRSYLPFGLLRSTTHHDFLASLVSRNACMLWFWLIRNQWNTIVGCLRRFSLSLHKGEIWPESPCLESGYDAGSSNSKLVTTR